MIDYKKSEYLKAFLLSIYRAAEPFDLVVSDRKTKKRLGTYFSKMKKIVVYSPLHDERYNKVESVPLEDTAIHEYAHHIHHTELDKQKNGERPHGPQFWRIYSALMAKALLKGEYDDDYITKIIQQ